MPLRCQQRTPHQQVAMMLPLLQIRLLRRPLAAVHLLQGYTPQSLSPFCQQQRLQCRHRSQGFDAAAALCTGRSSADRHWLPLVKQRRHSSC